MYRKREFAEYITKHILTKYEIILFGYYVYIIIIYAYRLNNIIVDSEV